MNSFYLITSIVSFVTCVVTLIIYGILGLALYMKTKNKLGYKRYKKIKKKGA